MLKRPLLFVRSVLPHDLAQFAGLFGIVFLLIAPRLRWAPLGFTFPNPGLGPRMLVTLGLCAIALSACTGYFVSFRPGRHPAHRLIGWVCLPAASGVVLMSGFYTYAHWLTIGLQINAISPHRIASILPALFALGPGFDYALVGLALVSYLTVRITSGTTCLPLALPKSSVSASDDSSSWLRTETFVWILCALLPTILWIFPLTGFVYHILQTLFPSFAPLAGICADLIMDLTIVLLALWLIKEEACAALRCSLRWPRAESLALAVVFPVGIAVLISAGEFVYDLARWSIHYSAILTPKFGAYFTPPHIALLLLLPFAFFEEVIFRGILQPRFVRRYGTLRGMLLVGVVFAAAHYPQDVSTVFTDTLVILKLSVRLAQCLALSFVAGWIKVRSGTVVAPALVHGLMNVLGSSPLGPTFPGIGPVTYLLEAALAYVLFRFWPVGSETCQNDQAEAQRSNRTSTKPRSDC